MARVRLVDPMATVDAVSRRALGVATQAEVDAAAGELQRYRDTDEARREAPVVTGSTADGTALTGLLAALKAKGVVVDATETVDDEMITGSVVTDELRVSSRAVIGRTDAPLILKSAKVGLTVNGDANIGETDIDNLLIRSTTNVAAPFTASDTVLLGDFDSGTTVVGTLDVTAAATFNGAVTLGDATGDTTTAKGKLKLNYRVSVVDAPAVTLTRNANVGSTGTVAANGTATDIAGTVRFVPGGTGIAAGTLVTVTFANAKPSSTDYAVLVSTNANGAPLQPYAGRVDGASFTIGVVNAPTTAVAFVVHYHVIDYT